MSQMLAPVRRTVTATDGLELAVYEQGRVDDPDAPTVVLVHGYPDNHTVWDGVAGLLADRCHVVRYDVRGAGESGVPARTRGYALPQLSADLRAVLDAVSPDAPVHLVGHDWGSIQSWESVTDPAFADRLTSFTSISGPSLDMAGGWMRGVRRRPRAVLAQLAHSYYIGLFQLPVLPELAARRGAVASLVAKSSAIGLAADVDASGRAGVEAHPVVTTDAVNGIGLYRANFAARMARPRPRSTTVPVQVLAPVDDPHVSLPLQTEAPADYVADLQTHELAGNHWMVENQPGLIAEAIVRYIGA